MASSMICFIFCFAPDTERCVGPSISKYSFRSPTGSGLPGGRYCPRVVITAPVNSEICARESLCVTFHRAFWGKSLISNCLEKEKKKVSVGRNVYIRDWYE